MVRKTREEKAITLIALIITIVVLLILAVVAINAVTGDGIIQHAVNAKTEYEKAQAKENDILSYYEEYLIEQTGWKQNGTKVSRDGVVLEVGDLVNYTSNSDTEVEWRVLGAQNGKILLFSYGLEKRVELTTGHIDEITKLNEACKDYDDGEYAVKGSARSINVEDIDRITGYNPLKTGDGKIFEEESAIQYNNRITYAMDNEGRIDYVLEVSGVKTTGELDATITSFEDVNGTRLVKPNEYTGEAGTATSIIVTADYYAYNPISLKAEETATGTVKGISSSSNAYKFLFENTDEDNEYYWLASVFSNLEYGQLGLAIFGTRAIVRGNVGSGFLSYSNGIKLDSRTCLVRAVITLESDVNLEYDKVNSIWKISK